MDLYIPSDFRFTEEKITRLEIGDKSGKYDIAFPKNKTCNVSERNSGVDGSKVCKNCYYREFGDKMVEVRKSKRKEFLEYQLLLREDKHKWLDELGELLIDNEDRNYSFAIEYQDIISDLRDGLNGSTSKRGQSSFLDDIEDLISNQNILDTINGIPSDIGDSVDKFRRDYSNETTTAFLIMQFTETDIHNDIMSTIKTLLKKYGIIALRADDKEYSDDLFLNIKTYMYCCDFGIAIYERITEEDINPNVSLEVGYMMGLKKHICLLKDKTLKQLPTDLAGKLYKPFNVFKVEDSINMSLSKWLKDKELIK